MYKILFITTVEFRPPFNGGTMYSHAIYKGLTESFNVEVLILKKHRVFQNLSLHKLMTMVRGLVSRVPLNVIFHSVGIRDLDLSKTDYKYIVVDHIEALGAIDGSDIPYILIAHNLEYKLSEDKLQNRFMHSIYQLSNRLRSYEYKGFTNAKGVICISASEAVEISDFAGNVVQLLPSFPDGELHKIKSEKIRFGFIGPANWPPNARTVQKLVYIVLPDVNRSIEFVLAGSGWANLGLDYTENTRLLGFVKNAKEFWENVDYLLAPTEQGAGVNVKICEALHYGVGVITNTKSANAIFGVNPLPESVFIADTNKELQELLNRIQRPEGEISHSEFSQKCMSDKLAEFWEKLDG